MAERETCEARTLGPGGHWWRCTMEAGHRVDAGIGHWWVAEDADPDQLTIDDVLRGEL